MKNSLDKIEQKLQLFFEGRINLFSNSPVGHNIIHELTLAMEKSTITGEDGKLTAPEIYTIHVSPDMLPLWQGKQDILDQISRELMQTARENGIFFRFTPVFKLSGQNNLTGDQIRVTASISHNPVEKTSAIQVSNNEELIDNPSLPSQAFLILSDGKIIPLNYGTFNIGRRDDNDLVIEDARVSRVHAQIRNSQGKNIIFDLNSTGGTFINGNRVYQQVLKPGDVISLASNSIIYGEEYHQEIQDTGGLTTRTIIGDDLPNPGEDI